MTSRAPQQPSQNANDRMRTMLDDAAQIVQAPEPEELRDHKRRSGPVEGDSTPVITLVEDQFGILRWQIGDPLPVITALGGRRMIQPNIEGEVIWEAEVRNLGSNTVIGMIQALDARLNGNHGLRVLRAGKFEKVHKTSIPAEGPILVLVHGTFSKTEAFLDQLNQIDEGRHYLSYVASHYKAVLAFDHATLSTSPLLNALELSRHLNQTTAEVDVISHSRGGLITRWWLEMLDRPDRKRRRAVVVGSTLRGTSLAAPDRVRKGFEHLSNVIRGVGEGAALVDFTAGISGLIGIAAICVGAAGKLPAVDAMLAMVPGLSAMSRIQNNAELSQLQVTRGNPVEYFGVKSNFEPPEVSIWQFWKAFNRPLDRIKDALADDFIFQRDGQPIENDLVVDCEAMSGVPPCEVADWCDFGTNAVVHHTNYFEQPETVRFIRDKLA